MSNLAVEMLLDKRIKLIQDQYEMNQKYNAEIADLTAAINQLRGVNGKAAVNIEQYDDENPDYIKGTEDGI